MKRKTSRGLAICIVAALLAVVFGALPVGAAVVPQDGNWTGTTNQGRPVSFVVKAGGTIYDDFKIEMYFDTFFCTATITITAPDPDDITGGGFQESGGEGGILGWELSFTGTFDGPTSAHGTFDYNDPLAGSGCLSLSKTGTWTATLQGSPPPVVAKCFGQNATITGTAGIDNLNGTPGDDVIVGLGGADTIFGRGGDDRICGGGGNDAINAGPGNDRVQGGGGNDTIVGDLGADTLRGGPGNDNIKGNAGNDLLFGDAGDDVLNGMAGADTVSGGLGTDSCYGESVQTCEVP